MNKKQSIKRGIWILLTVVWMAVIFGFSSDTADESSRLSLDVGKIICSIFVPEYEEMESMQQECMAEAIEYPVRKSAHATEYMILGILLSMSAGNAGDSKKNLQNMLWCVGIASVYAVSDELHQLWSPGRSCQIRDMVIDCGGAIIGIAVVNSIRILWHRKKKRNC